MTSKRKVEIFSAGCPICEETIKLVNGLASPSCDVTILDMKDPTVFQRAKGFGVRSSPGVAVDGKLAECCDDRGPDEASLRAAGVGAALP